MKWILISLSIANVSLNFLLMKMTNFWQTKQ